ncbi:hypothetical protein XENTR_v10011098 [Xenopus tropicalis]|nr:hypothetical protein XENTR_v10011098 [Xenopus tropicalis]
MTCFHGLTVCTLVNWSCHVHCCPYVINTCPKVCELETHRNLIIGTFKEGRRFFNFWQTHFAVFLRGRHNPTQGSYADKSQFFRMTCYMSVLMIVATLGYNTTCHTCPTQLCMYMRQGECTIWIIYLQHCSVQRCKRPIFTDIYLFLFGILEIIDWAT